MFADISDALREVVHQATPDLGSWLVHHSLGQDDKPQPPKGTGVLALVAVEERPEPRNRPPVGGSGGRGRTPQGFTLRYVVTYLGPHEEAQRRLARVVRAFHDTPVLAGPDLQPSLSGEVDSITVRLAAPPAEERHHTWAALGRAGRLALFYDADVESR